MKKLLFILSFICTIAHAADWTKITTDLNADYRRSFNTISDGGGKTYTTTITLQSNTTYQHYNFTGSAGFTSTGGLSNVSILYCNFTSSTGQPIFIGTYALASATAAAAPSSNIEIGYCTLVNPKGSQYYFRLQNVNGYNFHDCYEGNGTGTADGGTFYADNSYGTITNIRADNLYGKFWRLWPSSNSTTTITNCIGINSTKYSAMEIQEVAGFSSNFNVYVDNCTFGNLPTNGVPAAAITIYAPANPSINLYFGSRKKNIVFNTGEGGLLDDQGNIMKVGAIDAPKNANWNTANNYYSTMLAAGFVTDSLITLPDGTTWNSIPLTVIPPPPPVVNLPPIANAGPSIIDTLPKDTVLLSGALSTDPDTTITAYTWKWVSGPSIPMINTPTGMNTTVSGMGPGSYIFSLVVADSKGLSDTANVAVMVVMPAACPTPIICPICPAPIVCPVIPVTLNKVQIIGTHTDGTTVTQTIQ